MRTIQTNRVEAEMKYGDVRPFRGATEVAERVLAPINSDVEGLVLEVRELVNLGRTVAVLGRYTGTGRASGHAGTRCRRRGRRRLACPPRVRPRPGWDRLARRPAGERAPAPPRERRSRRRSPRWAESEFLTRR